MGCRAFITTPIYYVNSVPHIGTSLTTIAADITCRYFRLRGIDSFFLTGTDENGLKVAEAAAAAGETPTEFVDRIAAQFKALWPELHIEFDDFIRTTEPRHRACVQRFFDLLRDRGHIYKGSYEGWYDVSTETFFKESELVDGKSPEGAEVRWVQEDNWFFRMSSFAAALLDHIAENPSFILPETRKNEVVSFVKQGLRDICISRLNPGWGIPVPGDESRVIYVWFDALLNYLTATGWPDDGWQDLWPPKVEWMGKDILTRFHATLWPTMLLAAGLPLPETLVGHAWLLMGGEKISKSKGNVVAPLDVARDLAAASGCEMEVAVDAVRHYAAVVLSIDNDSTYTQEDFDRRYNADLANDLGNALNRTLAMAHRFVGGKIPDAGVEPSVKQAAQSAIEGCASAMEGYRVDRYAEKAMSIVRFLNKYIDDRAPWALNKAHDPALGGVIRSMLFCLRTAEGLCKPIMPIVSSQIAAQIGLSPIMKWDEIGVDASVPIGTALGEPKPIFPRIEARRTPKSSMPESAPDVSQPKDKSMNPINPTVDSSSNTEVITIEDFQKVKLRIARILDAAPLEGSDKLMVLQIVMGKEHRQIVAGIRKQYAPEELIGRQIVVVANLKPARLRGTESQGMLLAAVSDDGGAILLTPDSEAPEGALVR